MDVIKFISILLFVLVLAIHVKPAFATTLTCIPDAGYDACYIATGGNTAAKIQTASNPSQFKSCSVGGVDSWCAVKQYKIGYKCSGGGGNIKPPWSRTLKVYGSENSFSCSETSCSNPATLLASQVDQFDEDMDPGETVIFNSPHAIFPYTIACLFNPETDDSGDYWASMAVNYVRWPDHYVVNCVSNSDCSGGQICDRSGSWNTWQCTSSTINLPAPSQGEVLDQQQTSAPITKDMDNIHYIYAQTFTPQVSGTLNKVVLKINKQIVNATTPFPDLKIGITSTDSDGRPYGPPVTYLSDLVTIQGSDILTESKLFTINFMDKPTLIAGQTYAIVIAPYGTQLSPNHIFFGASNTDSYSRGKFHYTFSGSRFDLGNTVEDLFFGTYMTVSACAGNVSLVLDPSTVAPSGSVKATASGLSGCSNKVVNFKQGASCTGGADCPDTSPGRSCAIESGGTCFINFTAPSTVGSVKIWAFADIDGNSTFSANETASAVLLVTPACEGNMSVSIAPGVVNRDNAVTMRVSGLTNCTGKTVTFTCAKKAGTGAGACAIPSCNIPSAGTRCEEFSFTAPDTAGIYNIAASINSNKVSPASAPRPLVVTQDQIVSGNCGSGIARATGLVSTPQLDSSSSNFGTTAGCAIHPYAAFSPLEIPTFDDLQSLYFDQK